MGGRSVHHGLHIRQVRMVHTASWRVAGGIVAWMILLLRLRALLLQPLPVMPPCIPACNLLLAGGMVPWMRLLLQSCSLVRLFPLFLILVPTHVWHGLISGTRHGWPNTRAQHAAAIVWRVHPVDDPAFLSSVRGLLKEN